MYSFHTYICMYLLLLTFCTLQSWDVHKVYSSIEHCGPTEVPGKCNLNTCVCYHSPFWLLPCIQAAHCDVFKLTVCILYPFSTSKLSFPTGFETESAQQVSIIYLKYLSGVDIKKKTFPVQNCGILGDVFHPGFLA